MELGLVSSISRRFQNGSVDVDPNAGRRVFHALGELERSKAVVSVEHGSAPG
jgi:hypothetical protein